MARQPTGPGGQGWGGPIGDVNPAGETGVMLDVYVLDYLRKRQFHALADNFQHQANVPDRASPGITAPSGFLYEWWSVFWDIFIAQTNPSCATEAGILYLQAQQMKQSQQPIVPGGPPRRQGPPVGSQAASPGLQGMPGQPGGQPNGEGSGMKQNPMMRMMEQGDQMRRHMAGPGRGGQNMRMQMQGGAPGMPPGGPGDQGPGTSMGMLMEGQQGGGMGGGRQQMSPSMGPMGNRMQMQMQMPGGGNPQDRGMTNMGQQQMLMRNMQGGMQRMNPQRGPMNMQQQMMEMQQQRMGDMEPNMQGGMMMGQGGQMMHPGMGPGDMGRGRKPEGQQGERSISGLGEFDPAAIGSLGDVNVLDDSDSIAR